MKDFFTESLGQKRGCTLYTAKYGMFLLHSNHNAKVNNSALFPPPPFEHVGQPECGE